MQTTNDERLWRIAKKRVSFRKSLYSYLVVNTLLWAIWWFTTERYVGFTGYPWPIWVMLGWGVGLGFQYYEAYHSSKVDQVEQEFEKMKRQQQHL